jgi:hypothetical protein
MSALTVPGSDADQETWRVWVEAHSNTTNKGEEDFGLSRIAQHLGEAQTQAGTGLECLAIVSRMKGLHEG